MKKFKDRWDIHANWQLLFPCIGLIGLLFSAYLISNKITTQVFKLSDTDESYWLSIIMITLFFFIPLVGLTLKIFTVLEKKWEITYRWELIAIFIVFAITGSTAAKVSDPILSFLNFNRETTNGWIYWPLRIFLIFPIYQILLVIVGWIFGQFNFFWNFEKKMLRRMGLARFIK